MEVQLTPELEKKLNDIATQSGRAVGDLVSDALAGYVDELSDTRNMLDNRYDDIRSGRVNLIPGEEVEAYFREKSAAARLR
jgi:predicted transcriptional regulator